MRRLLALLLLPTRYHLFGSLAIVLIVSAAISGQMLDRTSFANSELHRDVMDRWGAPIVQPSPSVRFVPSGTVFNTLSPLALGSQEVTVDATMNYRKRGLVYFSGFDFAFRGDYTAKNDQGRDIDIAFVFPIQLEKNKVLLSNLVFTVNGQPAKADLDHGSDKLVWTGRLQAGAQIAFRVAFHGRGLDSLTYSLDPAAPVRNLHLAMHIRGGDNFDYPDGVVPANASRTHGDEVWLDWRYDSLQSGIPVGVILPSEKSFDQLIATMVRRGWAPFLLFFAGLCALCMYFNRPLRMYESYLLAASYGLFFVLMAYLAAFLNFYVAWALSLLIAGGLALAYLRFVLPRVASRYVLGLLASSLLVPSAAVVLQGYTGLIYTFEIVALIATGMALTTRPTVRALIDRLLALPESAVTSTLEGEAHVPTA
jgi:hypothetical protein